MADHAETLLVLQEWFETEWTSYYGLNGPGDAEQDLLTYCAHGKLPTAVIAFYEDELSGIAAFKAESIRTHTHLGPWAAAGLVSEPFRRKGIGTSLVYALENIARDLGYPSIYSGTTTANRLLKRSGWQLMERIRYEGEDLSISAKHSDQTNALGLVSFRGCDKPAYA